MNRTELLTVLAAAARLRVSKWMLYTLIRARGLRTAKIDRRRLLPVAALRDFLAERQEEVA